MISYQLSLFDTAAVIKPAYKVGDLVRVKKTTPHAPLLKKGDIVQIEAIHPHNGSCKFWNERTESWGYLYPDEFVSLPPLPIDSVSNNVETADTEYTAETGINDDSVSNNVETANTEYTAETGINDDSVSKAISTYRPRGTARSGEYFRFSYRECSRMRHIHIRGGNTDSPIAQARVAEVRSLLGAGIPPAKIAEMLRKHRY